MDVRFAFPIEQLPLWLMAGLLLLVGIFFLLRRLERHREQRLHRFVEADLAPRLLVGYDARARKPLFWLTLIGAAFLLLAAAQPRWGRAWLDVQRGSRDVLVLLDTSESMNAEDLLPSRMARAQQKVEAVLAAFPADRFGLVAFSGEAALQCPLTLDHNYFRAVLNATDTDTLSIEGTDIASALETAIEVFEEDAQRGGDADRHMRSILLISDGEAVSGDAVEAAREAAQYAVVNVMGIGDPSGAQVTYPDWMMRFRRVPADERQHLSQLDEQTLQQIALAGGGLYVRTAPTNADVEAIAEEMALLEARTVEGELRFHLVNRYQWPLAAAVIVFALEGLWLALLPWIRRRRLRRYEEGASHA